MAQKSRFLQCLFNLKDDPREENNLFGETSPAAVEAFRKTRELLEGFNRSLIPDQVQPCDLKSCPKNFEPQGCKYKTHSLLLLPLPTGNSTICITTMPQVNWISLLRG